MRWEAAELASGVEESICLDDFGPSLSNLGGIIAGAAIGAFDLSNPPADNGSVRVFVDGQEIPPGDDTWRYDEDSNRVVFAPGALPAECSQVEIQYEIPEGSVSGSPAPPEAQPGCSEGPPGSNPGDLPFDLAGGCTCEIAAAPSRRVGGSMAWALLLLAAVVMFRRRPTV